MNYEPTVWKTGDVVTSGKLNKLENAVANGGGILVINSQNNTLDKTYQEIEDAFTNKMLCIVFANIGLLTKCYFVESVYSNQGQYNMLLSDNNIMYIANTKDDYPVFAEEDIQ